MWMPGCPQHALLCTGSRMPTKSYLLHAVSIRIWSPSPSKRLPFSHMDSPSRSLEYLDNIIFFLLPG